MKSNKNPLSRKDNLVVQELDGEVLIYDLSENKAFCLNETSALVWQACDGEKTTAEISKFVSEKLNLPANEDLVWFALDQLKKEKLIENSDELPNNFIGMSRREVIKKVGLGTMIALPVVAAIVAPTSVQAQSICNMLTAIVCSCPPGQAANATSCTNETPTCAAPNTTCCGVMCNPSGNSCGSGVCGT